MNKPHRFLAIKNAASVAVGIACLAFVPPALAQQPSKFSSPYTKAAQASLQAIESDDSVTRDASRATAQQLDAAEAQASSEQEIALAKLLREAEQRRLEDNDLLHAYGKVIEVENASDDSDGIIVKRKKDSVLSQLADGEEDIMRREVGCFKELEQSLSQRSFDSAPACSEWMQKKKSSPQVSLIAH